MNFTPITDTLPPFDPEQWGREFAAVWLEAEQLHALEPALLATRACEVVQRMLVLYHRLVIELRDVRPWPLDTIERPALWRVLGALSVAERIAASVKGGAASGFNAKGGAACPPS